MPSSIAPPPADALLNRVETPGESALNIVESYYPDLSLDEARTQLGNALRISLKRSDAVQKEFGDRGQVSRICSGDAREIPTWLARAWARGRTRREIVLALGEESGFFTPQLSLVERERRSR